MVTTREVVKAALDPIRKNDLEARRRKLRAEPRGTRADTYFDVDPATVFRRERGPLVRLSGTTHSAASRPKPPIRPQKWCCGHLKPI